VVVATYKVVSFDDSADDDGFVSGMWVLAVFGSFALIAVFVGFVLSVIGLLRKEERRVFSILGFVLNGGILLLICLFVFRGAAFLR
jgi:hypothetical protein